MAKEEVMVSIGVDNSRISAGMATAQQQIRVGAEKMTSSIKNSLNGLKGGLLAGGLMNIFGLGEGLGAKLEEFKSKAASLGTWWGAFSVGGVKEAQRVEDAMATALKLGEVAKAKNLERWATEKKLADLLERRKQAEAEVGQVNETAADKLKRLSQEHFEILEKIHNTKDDDVKKEELRIKLAEKLKDVLVQKKVVEDATTAEKEKQKRIEQQQADLARNRINGIHDAFFGLQNTKQSDSQFTTVDELASRWGNGSQFQDEAQRIKQLERFEKYNRSGFRDSDTTLADKQREERQRLTQQLVKSGAIAKDPVTSAIETLQEAMEKKGILVKGAN